jgi:hypothetical protein
MFFNSTSFDIDGALVNWSWDMDDGMVHFGEQVVHQFITNDIFNVQLSVVDDDGASHVKSKMIHVGNQLPVAGFTVEPVSPLTLETVFFNSTSVDPDGVIVNWTWDMGDGSVRYGEMVSYVYGDDGDYVVELLVLDDDGGVDNVDVVVSVANRGPIVVNDSGSCDEDGFVWVDVVGNDDDVDGVLDLSTLQVISLPLYGDIGVNQSTGEILYMPDGDWFGVDSYVYQIGDDDGAVGSGILRLSQVLLQPIRRCFSIVLLLISMGHWLIGRGIWMMERCSMVSR